MGELRQLTKVIYHGIRGPVTGRALFLLALAAVAGCQPVAESAAERKTGPTTIITPGRGDGQILPTAVARLPTPAPVTLQPVGTAVATASISSPTPLPTSTSINQPTATFTPTPSPTVAIPTTMPGCADRVPDPDDLLAVITKTYGISRAFTPPDLVPLSDYFPFEITLGYPTQVRKIIVKPLQQMIDDMHAAGLEPQLISGYRDYYTQQLAYEKWATKFPDRADQLSAPPGHSEHQLGTTVDFGSPRLPDYIEDEDLKNQQFHTHFYMTPEGQWLRENAHHYGFTLSYPREAQDLTGFTYEPWHFRYVGVDVATLLKESGLTLTEFQLLNSPEPCG